MKYVVLFTALPWIVCPLYFLFLFWYYPFKDRKKVRKVEQRMRDLRFQILEPAKYNKIEHEATHLTDYQPPPYPKFYNEIEVDGLWSRREPNRKRSY